MKRPHRIAPHKNTVTDGPIPIAMMPAPQALRLYVRANLAMVPIWTAMATASPANPMLGNAENDVGCNWPSALFAGTVWANTLQPPGHYPQ